MAKLSYCPKCREYSVVYKPTSKYRFAYCKHGGCKYTRVYPHYQGMLVTSERRVAA